MLGFLVSVLVLTSIIRGHATSPTAAKRLVIDTDLFSDVDDAGALLLAATSPSVDLLAVQSLAASAILAHYGRTVPIGIRRPLTNATFFDSWFFELSEYTSKVAYHWSGGSLSWGHAEDAWDPVALYRKVLSEVPDHSVTIASIGFFDNLSGLLNSSSDIYSPLSGPDLIAAKVSELVIMGGEYPLDYEYNFWGSIMLTNVSYGNASLATHVVNSWKGSPITFLGFEIGENVTSGLRLINKGPHGDPVRAAYIYHGYNTARLSFDPLTVLYAMEGLSDLFEIMSSKTDQTQDKAGAEVDKRLLQAAWYSHRERAFAPQEL
ncbi:hypothetical protein QBC36DRAFT_386845 [Triangularia setosa]|uniref:Inosine/uridine-preferring nucleoside hydrolase domain-containing protein n=1 Tax=Triangularia setosa TaxID=2587417 RepID=A0AAN6WC06_9PEZI|nr:hypothetical protein QBC36DRAFT_386845 [Podospora setosa]